MPLLELLAWLLIAGGLLVVAGPIWLAFSINRRHSAPRRVDFVEVTEPAYIIGPDFQHNKVGPRFAKRPGA